MKILFDQGTPAPLRYSLPNHEVATAFERGWASLKNGDLLNMAEAEGFDAIVTTDQNMRYQQNLPARRLAIVVLMTTNWPRIQRSIEKVIAAINGVRAGEYCEVEVAAHGQ